MSVTKPPEEDEVRCKIPQKELLGLLEGIVGGDVQVADCSVTPTRTPGISLVTTTDFFYPLIDDPYVMGRIGCANVLSDLYSMGITEIDTMLMLLAASEQVPREQRGLVTKLLMQGFTDMAAAAGTRVTGGQSVRNPWPIIGGVATAVVAEPAMIRPHGALPGDALVLTKPLGVQVAVNAHQWLARADPRAQHLFDAGAATPAAVVAAYEAAAASMAALNRSAARLMHAHGARAATDVTGFGLLGHARNLAREQRAAVALEIDALPCIAGTPAVNALYDFGLARGAAAETSGGLLVALPPGAAQAFCAELAAADGRPAWVVGRVLARPPGATANDAYIAEGARVLEV
eukprot:m51a1_g8030 putative water dikinase (347) ;mRNA; f:25501-27512